MANFQGTSSSMMLVQPVASTVSANKNRYFRAVTFQSNTNSNFHKDYLQGDIVTTKSNQLIFLGVSHSISSETVNNADNVPSVRIIIMLHLNCFTNHSPTALFFNIIFLGILS